MEPLPPIWTPLESKSISDPTELLFQLVDCTWPVDILSPVIVVIPVPPIFPATVPAPTASGGVLVIYTFEK